MTTYNEVAREIVARAAASIGLPVRVQVIAADLSAYDPDPESRVLGMAVKGSPWLIVLDVRLIEEHNNNDQQRTALHELAHVETTLAEHTLGFFLAACEFQRRAGFPLDYDMQRYDGHESTRPLPELIDHYERHANALAALPVGSVGVRAYEIEQQATSASTWRTIRTPAAAIVAAVALFVWWAIS